jgi:hypothetical protein
VPQAKPSTPEDQPIERLSVAIVCKNNIATIGRTIESVRSLASEIVAVDSGSTDGTIELLERADARVIRSDWLGHVRTKQRALEACTRDWVLCIDSDESLEPELIDSIRHAFVALKTLPDGFEVNRRTYYKGTPLRYAWQPEWRLRLVRRDCARWEGLDPHDSLRLTTGNTPLRLGSDDQNGDFGGHLRHDSFDTFTEHMRKQWSHATTMARSLHAAGVRGSCLRLLISPPGAFLKQVFLKRAYKDGVPGWLAGASAAVNALIKHAALLELDLTDRTQQK